jgi:hypothetical protein
LLPERAVLRMAAPIVGETLENLNIVRFLFMKTESVPETAGTKPEV